MLCCQRDCHQRIEVGLIRGFSVKARMGSFRIIEAVNVASEGRASFGNSVIGPQIDLFVFNGSQRWLGLFEQSFGSG